MKTPSILTTIITAVINGLMAAFMRWWDSEEKVNAKVQLGVLEYENIAQRAAVERAKNRATTQAILDGFTGEQLLDRMRGTSRLIEANYQAESSYRLRMDSPSGSSREDTSGGVE